MQSAADPIVSCPQKVGGGGYQSIESGNMGVPMEEEKTFFGQVKEAKEQSRGCCDFCLIFFSLLISSIVWTIVMAIVITVPLAMVVMGAVSFNDCPAERMIPIFNIVAGCVITVNNLLYFISRCRQFSNSERTQPTAIVWISRVLNMFLFVWFFAGCYWVYHVHQSEINEIRCNATMYSFTFWLLTAIFVFFGTVAVASTIAFCIAMICW